MAIRGAFSAGLVSGFGKAFTKTVEDNWERYDQYIDQNLKLARSLAPEFAKSTAAAQQQMELADTMQKSFGLTDAEVAAIGQNYDMSKVYTEFLKHQQGLPQGVQVRKEDLLSILDIQDGDVLQLPEGMSKEDVFTAINLDYAKNVGKKPGDKSEGHKNQSWAAAVAKNLMLNPKVSAEQAVQQMSVMGIPVEDILLYQAAQASGKQYKPMNVGMAAGNLGSLTTDYNEESYGKTKRAFATALTRQYFPGSDGDMTNVSDDQLTAGVQASLAELADPTDPTKVRKAIGQLVNKGGSAFAKLENDILVSGYYDGFNRKSMREMALMNISDEISSKDELDKFMAAVEDGSLAAAIVSAGGATDEVIQALFGGTINDTNAVTPSFVSPTDMTKQTGRGDLDLEATSESSEAAATPAVTPPEAPVISPSLKNAGVVAGLVEPTAPATDEPVSRDAVAQEINKHTPTDIFGVNVVDIIDKVPSLADLDLKLPVMPTEEESMDALDRLPSHLEKLGGQAEEAWSEFKVAVDNYSYEMPEVSLGQRQLTQPINALQFMIAGAMKDAFGDAAQTEEDVKAFTEIAERGFDTEANQGLISYIRAAQRRAFKPMPEDKAEKAIKTANAIGKVDLGDLSGAPGFRSEERPLTDIIMDQRTIEREPELLSYDVWKDLSKAERASVGLDLPLVSIQNRVRSGSIPLPRGKSLPTPLRMKQERYLAASTESGTLPRTPKPDALMAKPTKQDLTAPTKESGVAVERTTGASKSLADLRTTFSRVHGKKSKTVKQLEKVLQQAQSGTPIQYTDVNLLLRATRSLPKTKTRDELAKKLYDIAQGLR